MWDIVTIKKMNAAVRANDKQAQKQPQYAEKRRELEAKAAAKG